MNQEALDLWTRACRSHQTSSLLSRVDPDGAASRAYYAAFYAVSALFALQGKTFTRHAALEAAVHRDLVKTGIWPDDLGSPSPGLSACARLGITEWEFTYQLTKRRKL